MCLQTYSEVDLAAAHHVVQEGVLGRQLQKQGQVALVTSGYSRVVPEAWTSG